MAIYEALRRHGGHPTAESLYREVCRTTGTLSLATVYNTLEALCNAGLVRRVPTTNGCCRYDAGTDDHLHVRFSDTGEIRDVCSELSAKLIESLPRPLLEAIEKQTGSRIESVHIHFTVSRSSSGADALASGARSRFPQPRE